MRKELKAKYPFATEMELDNMITSCIALNLSVEEYSQSVNAINFAYDLP